MKLQGKTRKDLESLSKLLAGWNWLETFYDFDQITKYSNIYGYEPANLVKLFYNQGADRKDANKLAELIEKYFYSTLIDMEEFFGFGVDAVVLDYMNMAIVTISDNWYNDWGWKDFYKVFSSYYKKLFKEFDRDNY